MGLTWAPYPRLGRGLTERPIPGAGFGGGRPAVSEVRPVLRHILLRTLEVRRARVPKADILSLRQRLQLLEGRSRESSLDPAGVVSRLGGCKGV